MPLRHTETLWGGRVDRAKKDLAQTSPRCAEVADDPQRPRRILRDLCVQNFAADERRWTCSLTWHRGGLTPSALIERLEPMLVHSDADAIWIMRLGHGELRAAAAALEARGAREGLPGLPLYGVPFAV